MPANNISSKPKTDKLPDYTLDPKTWTIALVENECEKLSFVTILKF